jgi:glycosyltransferase involved in cell wall biosynthesis
MQNTNTPKPKVSIIVAVYKVADYIEQCARSLFEQTLDDLEIIFVDDSTPDDSVAIIARTLQDYPNRQGQVKILHHEHNMDLPQTRKDGLNAATGEYLIFMDGDDWVEPNYAELL